MRIAKIYALFRKSGSKNTMVTLDFSPEVEIRPFRACAMHPAIIIGTIRSLWTWLWGRYHVPQNAFLVVLIFWFRSTGIDRHSQLHQTRIFGSKYRKMRLRSRICCVCCHLSQKSMCVFMRIQLPLSAIYAAFFTTLLIGFTCGRWNEHC